MIQDHMQLSARPVVSNTLKRKNHLSLQRINRINLIMLISQLSINAPQGRDKNMLRTFSERLLPTTRSYWNI